MECRKLFLRNARLLAYHKWSSWSSQNNDSAQQQSRNFLETIKRMFSQCNREKFSSINHEAIVSFFALTKARNALTLMTPIYPYFHHMEEKDLLKYVDVLLYVESLIYLIDENNEDSDENSRSLVFDFKDLHQITDVEFSRNIDRNRYLAALYNFLKDNNFYDAYVAAELRDALLYYKLEQWCIDCIRNKRMKNLTEYTIKKCQHSRQFDVHILNALLYKLMSKPYNKEYMEFLRPYELYTENLMDLQQYEEEILKDTFNIYRMYANLYQDRDLCKANFQKYITDIRGQCLSVPSAIKQKYPELADALNETLSEFPKDILERKSEIVSYQKCTLPEPILDEDDFRERHR